MRGKREAAHPARRPRGELTAPSVLLLPHLGPCQRGVRHKLQFPFVPTRKESVLAEPPTLTKSEADEGLTIFEEALTLAEKE